jgi:hypothetical protein
MTMDELAEQLRRSDWTAQDERAVAAPRTTNQLLTESVGLTSASTSGAALVMPDEPVPAIRNAQASRWLQEHRSGGGANDCSGAEIEVQ